MASFRGAEQNIEMEQAKPHRPAFFNLLQIGMPVGAVTSILHRVTGVVLALGVPFAVYLLDRSLQGPQAYARVIGLLDTWICRGAAILLVWALAHHALAGVRHLLGDIDVGSQLRAARRSAWMVNVGALAVTLLAAGALL